MKPERKPQLDQVDFEAMQSLLDQRGWHLFRLRVATMHQTKIRELQRDSDYKTVVKLRAEIDMLHAILQIPDILLAEARTGAEKQREIEEGR
jgi:hypothetical protein